MVTKKESLRYNKVALKINNTNHIIMQFWIKGKCYSAMIILDKKTKKENINIFKLFCNSGERLLNKRLS